jgi:RND family efflux transporter MFP subunit
MWTTKSVALCCVSSLALSLVGCGESPPEPETPVRPVKVHSIGSLQPSAMREYPGTIRAYQTAEMGFEVSGLVREFLVRESDRVEKGAVLARLDATDYLAEEKVAEANLAKAQADLTRSMNIFREDPGAISKEAIDRDDRAVKVFEAQLEIAQKAVADTELRAPFAGVMARKLVEDYANVLAKEPVLILQDDSVLEVEVAVPERDFVRRQSQNETKEELTKRLDPDVIVSALPTLKFPAVIKEYATTADPVTRTFPVKLNFANPSEVNILPGMTARVRIVVDPESAWSVPVTAAQADENEQPYVWKIDPESMKVSMCPVELGPLAGDRKEGRVLLKGGVQEGDMVAISGVTALREGMQVRKYEN